MTKKVNYNNEAGGFYITNTENMKDVEIARRDQISPSVYQSILLQTTTSFTTSINTDHVFFEDKADAEEAITLVENHKTKF